MLVFSNQVAKAAISITPDALALRLRLGSARLVERDAPIFEQALEGAISALDKAA
jgi:hypothetical protein